MAALVLALTGCRICSLGTDVPVAQLAAMAEDLAARAVALSVSRASRGRETASALSRLREALPRRVALVVGGRGAPVPRVGVEVIHDFATLEGWGTTLVQAA
jgi:methanogenic corrinoid protein MtbC1